MRFEIALLLVVLALAFTSGHATIPPALVQLEQQPPIELTGIFTQGVETGCILLHADDGRLYNLLNVTAGHAPLFGSRVLVRGYVEKDIATVCMQGIPFRVIQIQVLSAKSSASTSAATSASTSLVTSETTERASSNALTGEPPAGTQTIPLPWESVILGIGIGLAVLAVQRRRNRSPLLEPA